MRSLLLATAALGLSGALAAAHADLISIGLQESGVNGGAITTVATGNGSAIFSGGYGTFTLNNISGAGTPPLTEPALDSASINASSSTAGVLHVFVTEQGLSSPVGINQFLSSFTSNVFNGAITSVQEKTFIDTANGLYTGTLLASHTFTSIGVATSSNATPSLAAPYSETAEYIITTTGAGDVNDTIDISKVPEPASLAVLGIGLLGLGFIRRPRG